MQLMKTRIIRYTNLKLQWNLNSEHQKDWTTGVHYEDESIVEEFEWLTLHEAVLIPGVDSREKFTVDRCSLLKVSLHSSSSYAA